MKSASKAAFALMAASLFLAACGISAPTALFPSPTSSLTTGLSTLLPVISETAESISTLTPSSTATITPMPCDPSTAEYCIEDAWFVFQPPIAPPGADSIDRGYPYGSTEGGARDPHHGVEFYNGSGTPVLAAASGTVFYAGNDSNRKFSTWLGFYGNIIILEHTLTGTPFDRLYTLYAHLSKIDVSIGQIVTAGEKIGEVGLSGTASGSHLHFEVRVDANDYASTLNPELWLIPHPGNGTMAMQFLDASGVPFHPSEIQVQYFPDRTQPAVKDYYPEVYSLEPLVSASPFQETAALGDLHAGHYRISFVWAGILYDKWVEIQPEKLTRLMFREK